MRFIDAYETGSSAFLIIDEAHVMEIIEVKSRLGRFLQRMHVFETDWYISPHQTYCMGIEELLTGTQIHSPRWETFSTLEWPKGRWNY